MHVDETHAMPTQSLLLRPYEPPDEPQVRRVFRETLVLGRPLPFDDPHLKRYEHLCLDWYLTHGAPHAAVVVSGGEVRGYLLACLDQVAYEGWVRPRALAWAAHATARLATGRCRGDAARFARLRLRDGWRDACSWTAPPCRAHAHLNLEPDLRYEGIGHRLAGRMDAMVGETGLDAWFGEINVPAGRSLAALTRQGVTVHARTRSDTFSWLLNRDVERVTVVRSLAGRRAIL